MRYLNRRNYILLAIALFLSIFTIFMIVKVTNDNSLVYITRINKSYILMILVVIILSFVIDTIRVYELTSALDLNLSFPYITKFNLAMFFITSITPFGSGSLPLAIYLFNKKKIAANKVLLIFTSKLLFSGIFFGTVPPVLLIFFRQQVGMPKILLYFAILASSISTLLLIIMLYIILKPDFIVGIIKWIEGLSISKKHKLEKYCEHAIGETYEYNVRFKELFSAKHNIRLLSGQLIYSLIFWILFYSIAPLIMLAFRIPFNWIAVLARQFIFYDLLSYNIIPSGAGVMEVGFATIFSNIIPKAVLGIFIGIWRFFTYHVYLLISAFGFSMAIRDIEK